MYIYESNMGMVEDIGERHLQSERKQDGHSVEQGVLSTTVANSDLASFMHHFEEAPQNNVNVLILGHHLLE